MRTYWFVFDDFAEIDDGGETISSPTVSASPSGELTIGAPTVSSGTTKVLASISGGTAGTRYVLVCTVTTSGGATLTIRGFLDVVSQITGKRQE